MAERIALAAILWDGEVYTAGPGKRHGDIFRMLHDCGISPVVPEVQGFTTDTGRFVDRREAFIIAKAADQIRRDASPLIYQGDQLFSEDVW